MALARTYDRWEDEAVLEAALSDGSAAQFDERRFVAGRMWWCSALLEWLVLRGRAPEGARGGRIVTSLSTRIRSQYDGYEGIFGDVRMEHTEECRVTSEDISARWAFDTEIEDLLRGLLEESADSLRWFVSVARWKGADSELVISGKLEGNDDLLTPDEFKKGSISGYIRPKKKVFNQVANAMFQEMRSLDALLSKSFPHR